MYSTETSLHPERNYHFLGVKIIHFEFLLSLWSPVDVISRFLYSSSSLFPLVTEYTHPHHWLLSVILKIYYIKTTEWDSFTMTKTELTFLKRHILDHICTIKRFTVLRTFFVIPLPSHRSHGIESEAPWQPAGSIRENPWWELRRGKVRLCGNECEEGSGSDLWVVTPLESYSRYLAYQILTLGFTTVAKL